MTYSDAIAGQVADECAMPDGRKACTTAMARLARHRDIMAGTYRGIIAVVW